MIETTLNKIREHRPCANGWKKLLTHLGKTQADDEPLSLLTILESKGLDDAIWCFRACDGIEKEARLYAVACARRVQHLMKDQRSIDALDVAERFVNGQATAEELRSAWDAAWDAVRAAAAGDVARDVAGDAARDAAWAAANVAAWAAWAAWDAACAAREAAEYAAGAAEDAEIKWQEAEFRRVFCNEKAEGRPCA